MNRKAVIGVGAFLALFVGIIVAMTLIVPSAANIATSTDTVVLTNGTFTAPAANSIIDLTGQELINTPLVVNASGTLAASTQYTIAEGISATSGLKRIRFTPL